MPASEAQINANRQNALKSTGPRTEDGKAQSRANALKHGMTGAGVVLPVEDAAEVERMAADIQRELNPAGAIGHALARRVATLAVRMDRCVAQENAAISANVREAIDTFEAPEGVDDAEADQLRLEAGRRALFDPSKEACLARKYEAAAERGFFRALKELRLVNRDAASTSQADVPASASSPAGSLASFSPGASPRPTPPTPPPTIPAPSATTLVPHAPKPSPMSPVQVPFTIGKAG